MSHHNASSHNDSASENAGVNLSLTGAENNPDRLIDIVKYLRREKDILVGKVKVIEAESSRLKLELDSTRRELVKHHSSLEAAAERAQSESAALPSAKFKNLQVRKTPYLSNPTINLFWIILVRVAKPKRSLAQVSG